MTVCISAICTEKGEEHIVFAVDHMITTANGEFEHSINKYEIINKNTVAMVAGDALLMNYFMDLENFDENYISIQKSIQKKFNEKRREMIKETLLNPLYLDSNFIIESLNRPENNPLIQSILMEILKVKVNNAILLVGFKDNQAQISEITDGSAFDFRTINFHTIGSGDIQAQNTLLFQKQSRDDDLKTTLYNVYKAKKNAEVKQGVGKETEVGFVNKNKVVILNEQSLNILENIYKYEFKCWKEHKDLKKLKFD